MDYLLNLFATHFMPHGHCYMWEPATLWMHVGSDVLISLAYYSIPITLFYFVRRRQDLAFPWIFTMFGFFIFACGTTHVLNIVTTWIPYYRIEGVIKLATAGVSVATAVALVPLVPKALRLPSPSQLEAINRDLAREVEERKRAEEELRLLNATLEERVAERTAELARSNQDLERFAYAASHDMTEPLRMVRSYMHLLSDRYSDRLDDDAKEFMDFAVGGAENLQTHIDGLLDYSRARRAPQELDDVDFNDVYQAALERLRFVVDETGASVTSGPLPTWRGDRTQLTQLLQNLLGNAMKFAGDAPPKVEVTGQLRDDGLLIVVQDHGPGIAAGEEEKIFEMFHRLREPGNASGTGIGLALCRTIVERHRGRIWVEPSPSGGAAFHVLLPVVEA